MEGELVEDPADLDLVLSDVVKEIRERSTAHGNILEVQRKVRRALCLELGGGANIGSVFISRGRGYDSSSWLGLSSKQVFESTACSCTCFLLACRCCATTGTSSSARPRLKSKT